MTADISRATECNLILQIHRGQQQQASLGLTSIKTVRSTTQPATTTITTTTLLLPPKPLPQTKKHKNNTW